MWVRSRMTTWSHGFVGVGARNGQAPIVREGRAIFAGSAIWTRDTRPGYPGYDYSAETMDAHDLVVAGALAWLAQKAGSLDLLILNPSPTDVGYSFGVTFQDGLSRLGHAITLTGSQTSFGSYDPLDFDAVLMSGDGGQSAQDLDDLLDARGKLWSAQPAGNNSDFWLRYGADLGGYQSNSSSGAKWMRPFSCPAWGAGTFETVLYWDYAISYVPGAKTRPGTSTQVQNIVGQGNYVLWTQE